MGKILLDYVFPISVVSAIPAASTGFLKQVCIVARPKSGQEGNVGTIFECTAMTQVAARTDNTNAQQLFNAGMSKVLVLLADDLSLATVLTAEAPGEFFTLLITDDFDDTDLTTAQAQATATITSYANLVSTTPDTLAVAGVTFTAQSGAATPGAATFQSATSNDATATSLAAQINAHATAGALVVATAEGAVVTIKAKESGWEGNDIAVAYTDNDTNVGLTLAGLSGGKLSGGAGLFLGTFEGVVGISTQDADFAAEQAIISNRCAFYTSADNLAKNMFYAFGKILSNAANWKNQQYIEMPFSEGIDELGDAESFFDDKVSFVLSDDEFGNRLALFAVGGKAIIAPYILKNLRIDLQSRALQWIALNQPQYTLKEASLLEARLQEDVINADYIENNLIQSGTVAVTLEEDNFVANGEIVVSTPTALWRVVSEMTEA